MLFADKELALQLDLWASPSGSTKQHSTSGTNYVCGAGKCAARPTVLCKPPILTAPGSRPQL